MSGTLVPVIAALAGVVIIAGFVWWSAFAKPNAEKALWRRIDNEQLAHDAMIREEERQSAYAERVIGP